MSGKVKSSQNIDQSIQPIKGVYTRKVLQLFPDKAGPTQGRLHPGANMSGTRRYSRMAIDVRALISEVSVLKLCYVCCY